MRRHERCLCHLILLTRKLVATLLTTHYAPRSFSDNNVGNDVAGAFARSIGDQSCLLKKLTLAQNCLRSTGISRISGSLKDNHLLVFLDLARNPMGSKGALHLAEALKHNFVLRELLIDCCGIDAEGAKGLGGVLCVNKSLTRLDLADNSLLTKVRK